jgi:hypothetical protein
MPAALAVPRRAGAAGGAGYRDGPGGGRRGPAGQTAFDRLWARTLPATITVLPNQPGFDWARIRALPEVSALTTFAVSGFVLDGYPLATQNVGFPPGDSQLFRTIERPVVLQGRLYDPGRADEVDVSPLFPANYGKGVGDTLTLRLAASLLVLAGSAVAAATALAAGRAQRSQRRSAVAVAAANAGAPIPVLIGTRFALEPGRGRSALPVRPALMGAVAGLLGVLAAFTFSAGSRTLPPTRRDSGRPTSWRVTWASTGGTVALSARSFAPWPAAVTSPASTMRGSRSPSPARSPSPPTPTARSLASRCPLSSRPAGCRPQPARSCLRRPWPGMDVAATARRLNGLAASVKGGQGLTFHPPAVPLAVLEVKDVAVLPFALAGFLVLLAAGPVGHALATAVRRRRHELAVLRALGITRLQSRLVVVTQASVLAAIGLVFGVPLGVALGRITWRLVAQNTPFAYHPPLALWALVLTAPLALLAANLLAAWPGHRAARLRSAQILRAE